MLLMVVGMATVFVILLIVIYLGKGLIWFVNKYVPAEELPAKAKNGPEPVSAQVMAVIKATVAVVTHDKGKVAKVEKV